MANGQKHPEEMVKVTSFFLMERACLLIIILLQILQQGQTKFGPQAISSPPRNFIQPMGAHHLIAPLYFWQSPRFCT